MRFFRRLHLAIRAFCLCLWYGDKVLVMRLSEIAKDPPSYRTPVIDPDLFIWLDEDIPNPPEIDRSRLAQSMYEDLVSRGRIKPSGWIDTTRHGEP